MFYVKKQKSIELLISMILTPILILVLSMNIFNKFFYLVLVLFAVLMLFCFKEKIYLNVNLLYIFIFCMFYMLFTHSTLYGINNILKIFLYAVGYIIGLFLVKQNGTQEKMITKYILLIAFGACFHGVLNFVINYLDFGFNPPSRNLPDIWTGEIWGATGHNTVFAIFIGSVYYLFFIQKKFILKSIGLIGLISMILFNLMTASRTVFFLLVFVFIVSLFSQMFITKKIKTKTILIILISLFFLENMYSLNLFGMRDIIGDTPLYNRLIVLEDSNDIESSRFYRQEIYLSNLYNYPFGGNNIKNQIGYAHNLWLDTYDSAGVFPTLFLIMFVLSVLLNVFKLLKSKYINNEFKVLLIGVYSALISQFMVEPILEGVPWLFILFCIISGMTDQYLNVLKKNRSGK